MRIFSFILSFWLAVSAWAAITERYVSSTGTATYADSTNPLTPCSIATAFASGVAGDRFNVKADGTYSSTSASAIAVAGSISQPLIFRGYKTTIGDGFQGYNSDGSLNTVNFPTLSFTGSGRLNGSGSFVEWESLIVTSAASAAAMTLGQECTASWCAVTNSSVNAAAGGLAATSTGASAVNCDAVLSGASGGSYALSVQAGSASAIGCRVTVVSPTAAAIKVNNNCFIAGNIIRGNGGPGIQATTTSTRLNAYANTVYGCGNGIELFPSATTYSRLIGNLVTDGTGYGVEFNSIGAFNAFNRFRDNASGQFNNGGDWASGTSHFNVSTDTGGPETDFVSAPDDLGLIRLSPATGAGLPARTSIGALQRDQTTASGGQKAFAY